MDTYAAAIGVRNDLMQLFDARGSGPVALDPRRPDNDLMILPVVLTFSHVNRIKK